MSFSIADAVNGRNLLEGQPVVVFLVSAQGSTYPLKDNPNAFGNKSSHFFAIESLPIRGIAADCGRVEVADESQLSVVLALEMTGTTSWDELSKKAFHPRAGVQFMGREDSADSPHLKNRRVYGLCALHLDTYNHFVLQGRSELARAWAPDGFVGEYRSPDIKLQDIEVVTSILTQCIQSPDNIWRLPKGDSRYSPDKFGPASDLSRVCSLTADGHALNELFPDQDLPTLIGALGSCDGHEVGADLRELLRRSPLIGHNLLAGSYESAKAVVGLSELLGELWDCMHLRTRMYEVHAHFYPSFYAGQDRNFPSVMEMARSTLENVWAEFVDTALDAYGDDELSALGAELARTEDAFTRMRAKLKTRSAHDVGA